MKKNFSTYVIIILGLLVLAFFLDPQGMPQALLYVCIAVGCRAFGHAMGELVSKRALRNDPQLKKQMEIEVNDERNRIIADRAKGKAFDLMIFVFGALLLAFALMGIELSAVLLLVLAYLLVDGYAVYYRIRLEKEM